jgi:SAM-dependent methyltransferase
LAWSKDFFSGLWVEILTRFDERKTRWDVDFIEKVLPRDGEGRILDVPCGGGRISLELARRGYSPTGVDDCDALVEIANRRAEGERLNITWRKSDMRDLHWVEEFDMAICWGGSFGYFDDHGNARFLSRVCRALKPGGSLFMETHLVETLLPIFQDREWNWVAGGKILVLQDRRYDHITGRVECDWTLIKGGRTEKTRSSMSLYSYRELLGMLKRAGFEEVQSYDSKDLEEFGFGSKRLFVKATKAE